MPPIFSISETDNKLSILLANVSRLCHFRYYGHSIAGFFFGYVNEVQFGVDNMVPRDNTAAYGGAAPIQDLLLRRADQQQKDINPDADPTSIVIFLLSGLLIAISLIYLFVSYITNPKPEPVKEKRLSSDSTRRPEFLPRDYADRDTGGIRIPEIIYSFPKSEPEEHFQVRQRVQQFSEEPSPVAPLSPISKPDQMLFGSNFHPSTTRKMKQPMDPLLHIQEISPPELARFRFRD